VLKLLFQAYTALHDSSSALKKKKKAKKPKTEKGMERSEDRAEAKETKSRNFLLYWSSPL
jgi:hypothetical protein